MGLYRTDYIVYGWVLPQDIDGFNYWDEKNLPYTEGHEGVKYRIIRGEQDNDKMVFGHVINYCYDDWTYDKIDLSEIDNNDMLNKFKEIFGYNIEEKPHLFIFSNYM